MTSLLIYVLVGIAAAAIGLAIGVAIQKKSTGFYTLLEFDANPEVIKKLETQFRRDERVLRFLTFRLDKYAEEYAIKRRSLRAAKNNASQEVKEN